MIYVKLYISKFQGPIPSFFRIPILKSNRHYLTHKLSEWILVGDKFLKTQKDIVKTIQLNNSEVTLIGTAHVSQLSVEMVEEHIASGLYDCIAVELCPPRLENITNQAWWKNLDIYQVFKKKKAGLLGVYDSNQCVFSGTTTGIEKLIFEPHHNLCITDPALTFKPEWLHRTILPWLALGYLA